MKYYRNYYGYKVCYREKSKKRYVRHFITYTKSQAVNMKRYYIRYPPTARKDGHVLKKPRWKIILINRKEIKDGIWREVPF